MSYTKLFSSIVTSTIWTEDDKTRIVWITILAIADKNGEVQASIPGLARLAAVSVEACETAIDKFLSPDKYSRTPDDEGRRIEKIEGGWAILNHLKYREMASREDSKSAGAKRQKRYLDQKLRNAEQASQSATNRHNTVTTPSQTVTAPSQNVKNDATLTDDWDIAEADTDTDTKEEEEEEEERRHQLDFQKAKPDSQHRRATMEQVYKMGRGQLPPIPDECCEKFYDRMEADGWINIRGFPLNDWRARFREWATAWANNAAGAGPRRAAK